MNEKYRIIMLQFMYCEKSATSQHKVNFCKANINRRNNICTICDVVYKNQNMKRKGGKKSNKNHNNNNDAFLSLNENRIDIGVVLQFHVFFDGVSVCSFV